MEGEPLPLTPAGAADLAGWREAAIAWGQAFTGQTGQLAKANDRLTASLNIIDNCEAMVNAARPK